jgi:hypothetical protein
MSGPRIPTATVPFPPRDLDDNYPAGTDSVAQEIEDNIRQLRLSEFAPKPQSEPEHEQSSTVDYRKASALQLIAGAMQTLTYGQMMQISEELKILSEFADLKAASSADIAALLHQWALQHGSIVKPETKQTAPTTTTTTGATSDMLPVVEMEPTTPPEVPATAT